MIVHLGVILFKLATLFKKITLLDSLFIDFMASLTATAIVPLYSSSNQMKPMIFVFVISVVMIILSNVYLNAFTSTSAKILETNRLAQILCNTERVIFGRITSRSRESSTLVPMGLKKTKLVSENNVLLSSARTNQTPDRFLENNREV